MTNDHISILNQIEELSAQFAAQSIVGDLATADWSNLACDEYPEECDPVRLVYRIRQVIDRLHEDDSACENPLINVIEAVVYHATEGAAKQMGIRTD